MKKTQPPITDETTAERAIDQFLAGYDPLLYASDLGLTPEQVFDQIRYLLDIFIAERMARSKGGKKGGKARASALTAAQRTEIARQGALAKHEKKVKE